MDFAIYLFSKWETYVLIGGFAICLASSIFVLINDRKFNFGSKKNLLKKELEFVKRELDISNSQIVILNQLLDSYKTQLDQMEEYLNLYKNNLEVWSRIEKKKSKSVKPVK